MQKKQIGIKVFLKEKRLKAGLTQEDLAQRVGVRRETIVFLEQSAYNPSLKLALLIACELGTSVQELFQLEK